MPNQTPDSFSLSYDVPARLLVGRWHGDAPEASLYPSYERLLQAGILYDKCRFWLLDMRHRGWPSPDFDAWFTSLLAQRVVGQLGAPVFLAYVATESHRAAIESSATEAVLRHVSAAELYPYFFSNEPDARAWLAYYQQHLGAVPHLPQH